MHPADINAALQKRGSSQADIARTVIGRGGAPVSGGAVHLVIRGLSKSAAIAARISEVTGIPVVTLWPGKYPDLERAQARRPLSTNKRVAPQRRGA